jgi:cell division septum initiation protein DivIVA
MTIIGIKSITDQISALEPRISSLETQKTVLDTEAIEHAEAIEKLNAKVRLIDPKLIGEERSKSTSKIVRLAQSIFCQIKAFFYLKFGSLKKDLKSLSKENQSLQEKKDLISLKNTEIEDLSTQLKRLKEREFILKNQIVVYEPKVTLAQDSSRESLEFLAEIPIVKLATCVVSSASYFLSSAFSWAQSLLGKETHKSSTELSSRHSIQSSTIFSDQTTSSPKASLAPSSPMVSTPSLSTQTASSSKGLSPSFESDDAFSVASSVSTVKPSPTAQEIFTKEIVKLCMIHNLSENFGYFFAERFFPPIDHVKLNHDRIHEGVLVMDVTFSSKFKMSTKFMGYAADLIADKKIRLEIDQVNGVIQFEHKKFTASTLLGTFGLTSLQVHPSEAIILSGLPTTGGLSWVIKTPQKIVVSKNDVHAICRDNSYTPF